MIHGYITLNVIEKGSSTPFPVLVHGAEFVLEQGGGFARDDNGSLLGDSLHIAYFGEFDLMLHVQTRNRETVYYRIGARLKSADVLRVDVVADHLDTRNLLPPITP